jgi:hypothetical protein
MIFLVILGSTFVCLAVSHAARHDMAKGIVGDVSAEDVTVGCILILFTLFVYLGTIYLATKFILSLVGD